MSLDADRATPSAARAANAVDAGLAAFHRQLWAIDSRPCQHETLRRLGEAGVPVLVVHGNEDALAPVAEAHAAFASLGGAVSGSETDVGHEESASPQQLCVLEETGHLALVERPAEVAQAISAWWRRAGRSRHRAAERMGIGDTAWIDIRVGGEAAHAEEEEEEEGIGGEEGSAAVLGDDGAALYGGGGGGGDDGGGGACGGTITVPMSFCVPPPRVNSSAWTPIR